MNPLGQLAAIVVISFAAAGVTFLAKGPPIRTFLCDPATLKPDEICLEQIPKDAKILWVDARPRGQWEKSGLPGSVLWNLDPIEDNQRFEAEIVPKILETSRVIVYCGDENCGLSREVAKRIRALDLGADVSVLRGGWQALMDAGRIKDSNPRF
ncbi:MAG: rhodanese-like domain-containing protein [Luteolibacter sp.]